MNEVHIRLRTPDDEQFVMELFTESRPDLVGAVHLPEETRWELVKQQFALQSQHYRQNHPNAHFGIIQYGNTRIGRLDIERKQSEIHILELAISNSYRDSGIGSKVLIAIQKEAEHHKKQVRLHVEKGNTALEFYKRHGFSEIDQKRNHIELKWIPESIKDSPAFSN